ncbi:MAG: type II toxin-antitoxin system HicA family toxin [Solirubrobacterales bacterium]
MKRRDLERDLRRMGCKLVRHRGAHDIWLAPNGLLLPVPRHREIKEPLARAILRDVKVEG